MAGQSNEQNIRLLGASLVVILGGNAGHLIGSADPNRYRPDPFTGLDGANMEARIVKQISLLNNKVTINELRVNECMRRTNGDHNHASVE